MLLLQEICHRARHEDRVYREWGFDSKVRKRGLSVLFTGPPGSGKTMAAEILAGDLKLDVYVIDLSQVVDKYIGETEKNLARIFQAAEDCQAILFFDEADALFGKRSEVKDAHDRYANIETAFLLQKMEEYQGISVLATNLLGNMDEAFSRRLDVVVDFTEPDAVLRLQIWESHFPDKAPRNPDIDLPFLASRFKINGGTIRNIILTAAFQAARQRQSIGMQHLVQATRQELQKMGRFCARDEFGEYGQLL